MDSSSMSSSGSLIKRAPTRCFCSEKPVLVISWTPENPGRRFYECPNFWVRYNGFYLALGCQARRKCKFFLWRDDEICECGKVLIPKQRQWILTLEAVIAGYMKREKRLLICLGLSLVISGMLLCWLLLLVG
ncbi:uncharacterized protein LOC142633000 [Castanea sativa]|uniref:uncharacterized protein LOC142633000 n=1 Tax=Castanea sativa TaxID=21020 RepID=UPI003F65186C